MKQWAACFFILLLLGGCRSKPADFYMLNALPYPHRIVTPRGNPLDIGVGPIIIPKYLNRRQMVMRKNHNELQFAEYKRWAEPLNDNIRRVVGQNLNVLLPADRIFNYPWRRSTPIDYQVTVHIKRFEINEKDRVILVAQWSLYRKYERKLLYNTTKRYPLKLAPKPGNEKISHRQIAGGMSTTLLRLSRDIARQIKRVK